MLPVDEIVIKACKDASQLGKGLIPLFLEL